MEEGGQEKKKKTLSPLFFFEGQIEKAGFAAAAYRAPFSLHLQRIYKHIHALSRAQLIQTLNRRLLWVVFFKTKCEPSMPLPTPRRRHRRRCQCRSAPSASFPRDDFVRVPGASRDKPLSVELAKLRKKPR